MDYLIGAGLALGVCLFARVTGFDRDRVFYPTMLLVVAHYYILFAALAGSKPALGWETAAAAAFAVLAVAGFKTTQWLTAAGLAGHGVFDVFHHRFIANPGVPAWWPDFCMSFDVLAGAFLALLLARGRLSARGQLP